MASVVKYNINRVHRDIILPKDKSEVSVFVFKATNKALTRPHCVENVWIILRGIEYFYLRQCPAVVKGRAKLMRSSRCGVRRCPSQHCAVSI